MVRSPPPPPLKNKLLHVNSGVWRGEIAQRIVSHHPAVDSHDARRSRRLSVDHALFLFNTRVRKGKEEVLSHERLPLAHRRPLGSVGGEEEVLGARDRVVHGLGEEGVGARTHLLVQALESAPEGWSAESLDKSSAERQVNAGLEATEFRVLNEAQALQARQADWLGQRSGCLLDLDEGGVDVA